MITQDELRAIESELALLEVEKRGLR